MKPAPARPEVPLEIETPRLRLRAPHPDFAQEMHDAVRESFDELHAWMEWAREMPTVEELLTRQEQARQAFLAREDCQFVLFRGSRIVGASGLHRIDWSVPRFEIGYWVRTPDAGRGYVSETVTVLCDLAFDRLGARRVEIRADTRNTRSRAVPERLGFELEGVLRRDCLHVDGRPRDTAVYAKIR